MGFIVKNTTFINLSNLIAPHSCKSCGRLGEALCECCKKDLLHQNITICPNCKTETKNHICQKCKDLPEFYYLGERKGLLKDLIHDFKYRSSRAIGVKFAELLDEFLPAFQENAILVPLPTSTKHIRSRGFDHTLFITKHLAKKRGVSLEPILIRAKNTVQVGTDKTTRVRQADSAYKINPKIKINPEKTYILFDDVWTTGASMQSAIKKLRESGAQKLIIVLLAVNDLG